MALDLHDSGENDEFDDINMTPFIDVMLVLLIIFMVAAPLSTVDVAVDLPEQAAAATPREDQPVFVTITSNLRLVVNEVDVTREGLTGQIGVATLGSSDKRIYLRADKTVPYGTLMGVMNDLRQAGYKSVSLVALEAPAEQ